MRDLKFSHYFGLIIVCLCLLGKPVPADLGFLLVENDTIYYQAKDSLVYQQLPLRILELYGDAEISYRDLTLNAGYIRIEVDSQILYAHGIWDSTLADTISRPILKQSNETIYGSAITYLLREKRGKIQYGRSKFENGFYTGQTIQSIGKKEIYLTQSDYTTCDLSPEKRHYHFRIAEIKVLPNDKVLARNILFYFNRVPWCYLPIQTGLSFQDSSGYFYTPPFPIFYFPLMMFPIRRDRHSGVLMPKIGKETIAGQDIYVIKETGYYWAINDYSDNLTRINFYNTRNILLRNEFRYNLRYRLNGNIDASWWYRPEGKEWQLRFQHQQEINPTTRLNATGNFLSNQTFYQQTSDNLEERLNRQLNSSMLFSHRFGFGNMSININRNENLDTRVIIQHLPRVSFNLNSFQWYNTYLGYRSEALYYYHKADSTRRHRAGATHSFNINRTDKIKTWLRLSQTVSVKELWFDEAIRPDSTIEKAVRKMDWDYSATLGNTLYGVFAPQIFGIKVIRHKIDPAIGITYSPADTHDRKFEGFSTISYFPNPNSNQKLTFKIDNLFQAKLANGETDKKIDLFYLNFYTAYDVKSVQKKWSDLQTSFRMQPLSNLNITINSVHNFYAAGDTSWQVTNPFNQLNSLRLNIDDHLKLNLSTLQLGIFYIPIPWPQRRSGQERSSNSDSSAQSSGQANSEGFFKSGWQGEYQPGCSVTLRHSLTINRAYTAGIPVTQRYQFLDIGMDWVITHRWKGRFNARYDIERKELLAYSFVLNQDLHCWEFMFTYRKEANYRQFYWIINIKQLPDIKLEQFQRLM